MLERYSLNHNLRIQIQTADFVAKNKDNLTQHLNTDFIGDITSLRTYQPNAPDLKKVFSDHFIDKTKSQEENLRMKVDIGKSNE